MTKIFVGGFPLDFTELEIVMLIGPYADVSTIKVVRDKKTKVCKGYAFLEINDPEQAERAVEMLDGTSVSGRVLNVKIREESPVPPPKAASSYRVASDPERKKRPRKQF